MFKVLHKYFITPLKTTKQKMAFYSYENLGRDEDMRGRSADLRLNEDNANMKL